MIIAMTAAEQGRAAIGAATAGHRGGGEGEVIEGSFRKAMA